MENELELKSNSVDERVELSKESNFPADVVNWRSLVKHQQED